MARLDRFLDDEIIQAEKCVDNGDDALLASRILETMANHLTINSLNQTRVVATTKKGAYSDRSSENSQDQARRGKSRGWLMRP